MCENREKREKALKDFLDRRIIVEAELMQTRLSADVFASLSAELAVLDRRIHRLAKVMEDVSDRSALHLDFDSGGSGGTSITIFFLQGVNMTKVKELTEKCLRKKWMNGAVYAYEQKGETVEDMGHNSHVHIFLPKHRPFKQTLREVYNTYKTVVNSQASVHIKPKPPSWFAGAQNYLRGDKADTEKLAACQIDIIWRQRWQLPGPDVTAQV